MARAPDREGAAPCRPRPPKGGERDAAGASSICNKISNRDHTIVRHRRALFALAAGHAVTALLAAVVYFRARVAIREAFRASGAPIPPLTALALSPYFLPLAV